VNEAFIHYLWQFQYFDKKDLKTTTGERLTILKPSILNSNAGPDFSDVKIKVDEIANKNIFSTLLELQDYKSLVRFFEIQPSAYWQHHYRFGKKSKAGVPDFGESSRDNIIINTVVPLLVAYGQSRDDWSLVERAVTILQFLPIEKNRIARLWNELGYASKTAFDSQEMIELYNNYCQRRECLNCSIGSAILRPQTQ